jgi:hypothetical protein
VRVKQFPGTLVAREGKMDISDTTRRRMSRAAENEASVWREEEWGGGGRRSEQERFAEGWARVDRLDSEAVGEAPTTLIKLRIVPASCIMNHKEQTTAPLISQRTLAARQRVGASISAATLSLSCMLVLTSLACSINFRKMWLELADSWESVPPSPQALVQSSTGSCREGGMASLHRAESAELVVQS